MKTLLAACLLFFSAVVANAATYSVEFSFTNRPGLSGEAEVTGVARGLTLGVTGIQATSVEITGYTISGTPSSFGLGEYVLPGAVRMNYWTLDLAGNVLTGRFISNLTDAIPAVSPSYGLAMTNDNTPYGTPAASILENVPSNQSPNAYVNAGLTFGQAIAETAAVPLPAAGWLLLGGLGGIAALRRRKV
ncbi:VPLPA-CTERM sorting domain-containing protein [Primorskyibacter sp. 2E107]|uniref:VPLPA-CTERM sorting domain-containing protein n=1 Tax=Primorskyibacter sp. 2E107 TaxID=3403458 RepID=UPI003AF4D99C